MRDLDLSFYFRYMYVRIVWVFKEVYKLYAVKLFYIHLYVVFYVIDDYKLIINKVLQSIVEVFISDKYFYARHDIYAFMIAYTGIYLYI